MRTAAARRWQRYTLYIIYIMYRMLPETKKVRGPEWGRAPLLLFLLCSLHYIYHVGTNAAAAGPPRDAFRLRTIRFGCCCRGTLSSQNDPLRVLLSSDESESDSMTRTVSVVWV